MKKKIYIISLILFIFDLVTKLLVDKYLNLMEQISIIPDFFSLTKVYNYGASFNILTNYSNILIIISIAMLIVLYIYQKSFKENIRNIMAFSLLYGGILGNLINRITYGYVIDFFDFLIFNYNYPVFNFADIFIVYGIILLVVGIFKKEDLHGYNSRK